MPGPVQFSRSQILDAPINEPEDEDAISPRPVAKQKPSKLASRNVVQLAKARLREIKAELRHMKALEKERAQLERLIAAAEEKPRAVVREIKRTAG